MHTKQMDFKWDGTSNTILTFATIFWAFISRFIDSWSDAAGFFACLAGASTVALNVFKYIQIRRNKSKPYD